MFQRRHNIAAICIVDKATAEVLTVTMEGVGTVRPYRFVVRRALHTAFRSTR